MELSEIRAVRIGGIEYKVVIQDGWLKDDNEQDELWGRSSCKATTLFISGALPSQVKPCVLIHEALHAMLYQAGHPDVPEDVILALGYGVVALLRDNPDILKLIGD